jgi:hypothetical protein
MRLRLISHLSNELGIPTIPHVFSNSQSLIASIKNRMYCTPAVAHIGTKYNLGAVIARDGEIDLSYVPTAGMLANFFTKPLPNPAILKQCAEMGLIRIGLGNGLTKGLRSAIRNGLGNDVNRH